MKKISPPCMKMGIGHWALEIGNFCSLFPSFKSVNHGKIPQPNMKISWRSPIPDPYFQARPPREKSHNQGMKISSLSPIPYPLSPIPYPLFPIPYPLSPIPYSLFSS
jgi:hypothetical protein